MLDFVFYHLFKIQNKYWDSVFANSEKVEKEWKDIFFSICESVMWIIVSVGEFRDFFGNIQSMRQDGNSTAAEGFFGTSRMRSISVVHILRTF